MFYIQILSIPLFLVGICLSKLSKFTVPLSSLLSSTLLRKGIEWFTWWHAVGTLTFQFDSFDINNHSVYISYRWS